MSIQHHIQLYFPRDHFKAAISHLIQHIDKRETKPFNIPLLNGDQMEVFCSPYVPPSQNLRPDGHLEVSFDTTFLFRVDAVIQEQMNEFDLWAISSEFTGTSQDRMVIQNGELYFPIGNLRVSLASGSEYCQLTLSSVSSSQNRMIRHSPSIHGILIDILKTENGVAGLINVETRDYIVLTDTSRTYRINIEEFKDGDDIDGLAKAIMAGLADL